MRPKAYPVIATNEYITAFCVFMFIGIHDKRCIVIAADRITRNLCIAARTLAIIPFAITRLGFLEAAITVSERFFAAQTARRPRIGTTYYSIFFAYITAMDIRAMAITRLICLANKAVRIASITGLYDFIAPAASRA